MSQQGMRPLLGCLQNVQWCDSLPRQLWEIFLLSEGEMDYITLLGLDGNQLHLPVEGDRKLFERAVTVLQKIRKKVKICLHWERENPECHSLCETLLEALPYVSSLSFRRTHRGPGLQDQERCYETLKRQEKKLFLDLCLKAATLIQGESVHNESVPAVWSIDLSQRKSSILLEVLRLQPEKKQVRLTGCSGGESEVKTLLQCLPYISQISYQNLQRNPQCDFLLDLYSHLKDYETETGLSVLPSLQSVLQSVPKVWSINLSQRKSSILLEVLRLQPEKKQVELRGCSDGESEVRTFLQCLPYISQLSFRFGDSGGVKIFGTLFCAAAEREQQTGEKTLELLSSVCTYPTFPLPDECGPYDVETYQCDFLLDLYSHLKDYETETGLSVLPSLQSVLQSVPKVWTIDLSQRKSSILLEVLRLQPEKKQVRLRGCSDGESEVRTFLQCLPYISQLSFRFGVSGGVKIFETLFCAAAEREQQTGEKTLELLSSVCTYPTFPLTDISGPYYVEVYQGDFLLDLYSHLKDYETETGLSVLPSLQSVLQSAPKVWSIDLSERKSSILLEVLRLQPEKKQVRLRGCSYGESEVRTFLQCLPYISQLSFRFGVSGGVKIFGTLFCAAAEREQQTGEKTLELLSSVCTYPTFPLTDISGPKAVEEYQGDFLLDLYSHLKDYETETGLSVLPSLQSFLQSAPKVWTIDLSQRKSSILLEVLRLQPEKKQVRLRGCSDGESEVRTLLQCLPYISQLSFRFGDSGGVKIFGTLFCAAAEREQQTGEKTLELLSSVCTYPTFPLTDEADPDAVEEYQGGFLLDLYSHLKDYETETGLSVLPSLQSVLQSAPKVWTIDLSERKSSILLEVLRLQPEKKQVRLRGCSDGESEVRTLLQCLPYISQLSFRFGVSGGVMIFGTLFCAAAEREQQTGEKTLELLSSVCTYPTFPLTDISGPGAVEDYQGDFLLDLYSHLKDYETETGLSVLPSLQSVLQSVPKVWTIDLSKRKSSILLEVLRLQPEKKQVELTGCSDGESEVRTFLQCLPYISQLSCGPEFFQRVCTFIYVRSREEAERLASLLQLSGFTLLLSGELPRKTCLSVGRVLQLCGSKVDLILKPRKMSVKGALALFRRTTQLHSLKLSKDMALLLCGWVRRWGVVCQVTVEELSLSPQTTQTSRRVLLKVVSSLASLLRYWAVRQLDLTEVCVPALGLTPLLLHDGPLKIKLSEKNVLQLLSLLHELQDQDLTWSFLSKLGGDLTSFSLNWELLHLLLQHPSAQTLTVNMRKNLFLQENITRLLPYLDRIVFKRPCPSFVLTAIREIYKARASSIIPSLLRSLDHVINLTCREMSPMDCAALLYTLAHSDGVKLNLLWTSIPAWKIESILLNLDNVSQLSVDRNLLLRMVHGCAASDAQQGAAESLLRTVQHRLDLSCSSCVELPEEDQSDTLRLTAEDCRAVSTILRRSRRGTQLILQDCEVQDSGLDLLFPVLPKVKLRASKAVLLQLVSLVPVNSERDTVGRAVSLCKALEGELDLSHSSLDQRACAALALMLDFSEELTELDLSHCQLTDQLLLTLSAQLHKVQVLDLSHNNITDASTDLLLQLVSINPSIHTVRLFGNKIVERTSFVKDKKFEIW
ncbi:NACHT LRR and PYD domains-containing protein 14 [Dissostichus eleginoides]|uniref:NACHT LRR and PYD domains-containing protein 14 n=1 Tax=Dissostichus eleginoides TaxID=100907 RepID=A0AAD9FK15_DISEL|nr:NACHT LRR and PYD domains-containing protein 14 [Dissostichus eleginoides]